MLYLAEPGAKRPFALARWATGTTTRGLQIECEALHSIHSRGDQALAASCPAIWGPIAAGQGAMVSLQRCLPGHSAYIQLRGSAWPRALVRGHFDRVAGWLERFWSATAQPPQPLDESLLWEHIEQPLRQASQRFGQHAVPEKLVETTLAAARAHLGHPVPLVAQHGDLWASNLLVGRAGLYVVDWEHYSPSALPAFDMLFFCATYAMDFPWQPFRWLDHRMTFARAFVQPTWFARHIMRFLGRCCEASGLSPSLIPVLLPVTLAQVALRRAEASVDPAAPARIHGWTCWRNGGRDQQAPGWKPGHETHQALAEARQGKSGTPGIRAVLSRERPRRDPEDAARRCYNKGVALRVLNTLQQ